MVHRTSLAQFERRVLDEPEANTGITGRQFIYDARIQNVRPETFHPGIPRTGHHRVVAAMEDWDTQPALVLQCKPIAVGTLHPIETVHLNFLHCRRTALAINSTFILASGRKGTHVSAGGLRPYRIELSGFEYEHQDSHSRWSLEKTNGTRRTEQRADPDVESNFLRTVTAVTRKYNTQGA